MKAVLVTGGFDPIHSGHISYIKEAKKLGDRLVVGLNSDEWLIRKKSSFFMEWKERASILQEMKCVDKVIAFDDSDGSARDAIQQCLQNYDEVIFANGGDRLSTNIPEMKHFGNDERVSFVFGVGGSDKMNSSSKILAEWKSQKVYRDWGYYRVLHNDGIETKVKELVVNPRSSLSLQKHNGRSEHWIVTGGEATVKLGFALCGIKEFNLQKHQEIDIPVNYLHQLSNRTDDELRIVEIQYGAYCTEDDIQRFSSNSYILADTPIIQ